jgi:sulfhydrogenase subunit beta (sulfur reductase)
MNIKVMAKEEFAGALSRLKKNYTVYAPKREGDYYQFKPLDNGTGPDFPFTNTRLSPKFLMQPQSEKMFEYSLKRDDPEAHVLKEVQREYAPRAVVGIRPCDAKAIELVKVNFNTREYKDPFWTRRYHATILVGLACNQPCSTCFCSSVGSGPFHEEGLDVLLVDMDARFLVKALTPQGEELIKEAGMTTDATDGDVKAAASLKEQAEKNMASKVPTDKLAEKQLMELFDAPFWDEVAFSCINCGTCTYLCPTCWCFDIQDEVFDNRGIRMRNWDACMYPLFTLHGSGHNPRDLKTQRVRQRFMHKLKYYVDKYGDGVACVGCGRCVQFCPVNIDIRKVFRLMNDFGAKG